YVHRIGRTARAGLPGEAISLVAPDEVKYLEDIEKLLKLKLPRASAPDIPAESRPAHRPREARHERSGERQKQHERGRERRSPRQQPAAPQPSPAGFDYTKPYEPASSDRPAPPETAPAVRRGPARPTAALLGGNPAKREPHK
ncbi:MAG: DEAD/DEAH box helicase, partial [Burkholderiales bacterium]